jgi:hypothetical protein
MNSSPAQRAHRKAFVDIVRLSSRMKEAYSIGLQHHAMQAKIRTYADFRSVNKDCFTPEGLIDYTCLAVSLGNVVPVVFTSMLTTTDKGGEQGVTIAFDPVADRPGANKDDEVYLYVYCPTLGCGVMAEPMPRMAGNIGICLPAGWPLVTAADSDVHLYAFTRDSKGRCSNTMYVWDFVARN